MIINVKITLTDPFVMMGEQVFAQTTTGTDTGTGTGTSTETTDGYDTKLTQMTIQIEDKIIDSILQYRNRSRDSIACTGVGQVECTPGLGPWGSWSGWIPFPPKP